jgi:hypothetical protein
VSKKASGAWGCGESIRDAQRLSEKLALSATHRICQFSRRPQNVYVRGFPMTVLLLPNADAVDEFASDRTHFPYEAYLTEVSCDPAGVQAVQPR